MEFTQLTSAQFDYFVHDIAFDYYGRRFATCSTDGKIKIWDSEDDGDETNWKSLEIAEVSLNNDDDAQSFKLDGASHQ